MINRDIPVSEEAFLTVLSTFNQIRRPGAEGQDGHERDESACCNTEGGGRSFLEGLEDSGRPCARVLSVAGLFVVMGRFLLAGGFILRLKEAPFLRAEALHL